MIFKKKKKDTDGDAAHKNRVAIDIGLSSIKCAYFENNLLCLEEFPYYEDPKDITGLKQQELLDIQTATVNKAVSLINPKAEFIFSPQPSLQVLTRIVRPSPGMDIRTYLDNEMPFDPDKIGFDTHRIDMEAKGKKAKKSERKSSRIAVTCTDLDFIQRSISMLGEYQLQIKWFTPGLVALINYLSLTSDGDQPTLFLDLGSFYSHLIVYKGMGQFLARTLELGGNHLNQELVEKLNVDFETAEKIKKERKLIDDKLFDSKGSITSLPMFQAINKILFGLVDDIKNSITYFEDAFMVDFSDGVILLAGGTSNLQNLDRFLNKEIDLPVKKAEDTVHDLKPGQQFSSQFASTIGLMGKPSHAGLLEINLINNIEGMLFKLQDREYYLTKDGFVDKKGYRKKKKAKSLKPSVTLKGESRRIEEPVIPILDFIKELPGKIGGLLKGETIEMPKVQLPPIGQIFDPIKGQLKTIFVLLGGVFLIIYAVNQYYWAPMKKGLH